MTLRITPWVNYGQPEVRVGTILKFKTSQYHETEAQVIEIHNDWHMIVVAMKNRGRTSFSWHHVTAVYDDIEGVWIEGGYYVDGQA